MGKHVAADERSPEQSRLRLGGVVRVTENRLAIRNRILRQYFQSPLGARQYAVQHLPPGHLRGLGPLGGDADVALTWPNRSFCHSPTCRAIRNWSGTRRSPPSRSPFRPPTPKCPRADLDQKEVLVPRDGTIRATLTDLPIGAQHAPIAAQRRPAQVKLRHSHRSHLLSAVGIASISLSCHADIFDELGFEDLSAFAGHRGPVSLIAFAPDGKLAVSGSSDGTFEALGRQDGRGRAHLERTPRRGHWGSLCARWQMAGIRQQRWDAEALGRRDRTRDAYVDRPQQRG